MREQISTLNKRDYIMLVNLLKAGLLSKNTMVLHLTRVMDPKAAIKMTTIQIHFYLKTYREISRITTLIITVAIIFTQTWEIKTEDEEKV